LDANNIIATDDIRIMVIMSTFFIKDPSILIRVRRRSQSLRFIGVPEKSTNEEGSISMPRIRIDQSCLFTSRFVGVAKSCE
jgi:hypothetical protein